MIWHWVISSDTPNILNTFRINFIIYTSIQSWNDLSQTKCSLIILCLEVCVQKESWKLKKISRKTFFCQWIYQFVGIFIMNFGQIVFIHTVLPRLHRHAGIEWAWPWEGIPRVIPACRYWHHNAFFHGNGHPYLYQHAGVCVVFKNFPLLFFWESFPIIFSRKFKVKYYLKFYTHKLISYTDSYIDTFMRNTYLYLDSSKLHKFPLPNK